MNTIINIYYFEYTSSRKLWTKENKRRRKTKRFSLPFITVRIPPTIAQSIIVMPRNLLNPDPSKASLIEVNNIIIKERYINIFLKVTLNSIT